MLLLRIRATQQNSGTEFSFKFVATLFGMQSKEKVKEKV